MQKLFIIFLLLSPTLFAQPLILKIESITERDSLSKLREFKVKYYVKNNTKDTLRFFLDRNSIHPSTGGSMSPAPFYKISENEDFIEVGQILQAKGTVIASFKINDTIVTQEEYDQKEISYLSELYEMQLNTLQSMYNKKGMTAIHELVFKKYYQLEKERKSIPQVLAPNEKLECIWISYWDKNRYFYKEPNEYYLGENAKHYFELTFVALKEEYQSKIDVEIFEKIMKMPNFIKGVFVSNKVEINFN